MSHLYIDDFAHADHAILHVLRICLQSLNLVIEVLEAASVLLYRVRHSLLWVHLLTFPYSSA